MRMTMYEIMKVLNVLGAWRFCLAIWPKFETLVLYYRIYEIARSKISHRKYGYLVALLQDGEVVEVLPKDRFGAVKWTADDLRWAIREMEREVWV